MHPPGAGHGNGSPGELWSDQIRSPTTCSEAPFEDMYCTNLHQLPVGAATANGQPGDRRRFGVGPDSGSRVTPPGQSILSALIGRPDVPRPAHLPPRDGIRSARRSKVETWAHLGAVPGHVQTCTWAPAAMADPGLPGLVEDDRGLGWVARGHVIGHVGTSPSARMAAFALRSVSADHRRVSMTGAAAAASRTARRPRSRRQPGSSRRWPCRSSYQTEVASTSTVKSHPGAGEPCSQEQVGARRACSATRSARSAGRRSATPMRSSGSSSRARTRCSS